MVTAKSTKVKEDKHYPPRCTVCNNEIYTFTESNDTCVIEAVHECKSTQDIDQSAVEDVFTSSGLHTFTEKQNLKHRKRNKVVNSPGASNSEEPSSPGVTKEQDVSDSDTGLASLQEDLSSDEVASPSKEEEEITDDQRLANIPDCETSILVIADENSSEIFGNRGKEEGPEDSESGGGEGAEGEKEEDNSDQTFEDRAMGEDQSLGNTCGEGKGGNVGNNDVAGAATEREKGVNLGNSENSAGSLEHLKFKCSSDGVKENLSLPKSPHHQGEKEALRHQPTSANIDQDVTNNTLSHKEENQVPNDSADNGKHFFNLCLW